ncbi:sensor histidine kinase [Mariniluteicoccus flavus]
MTLLPRRPAPGPLEPVAPLGPGTLGRKLLLRVALLVTAVAIALSTLTALSTAQLMTRSLDRQLDAAFSRQMERGPRDNRGGGRPPVPANGQPVGALLVDTTSGTVRGGEVSDSSAGVEALTVVAAERLLSVPADGRRESVVVPGYGRYRVKAVGSQAGTAVVALPLREVERTLVQILSMAVALTMLAIGAAVLGVRRVVRESLKPLNRLAGTAHQVSQLELSRGEVDLGVRVPEADADPRTEVGQVGTALNHLLANVEGALATRQASETKVRQFVADASHELRNPLAAIRGYAELTRRDRADLPPDTAFAMDRVESEAERMSRLVEDLLLLARMDSNPNLQLEPVNLNDLVLNAVSDAQAANPAYDWGVELAETPVRGVADRHRLHQVVANLLANARKHTPEGTAVTVAVRQEGPDAVITVTDDGPGIDPAIVDRVFERFTRADTARTRSGLAKDSTGLGLAIVQSVMEAHGGRASVESRPGHTEFTLRLRAA